MDSQHVLKPTQVYRWDGAWQHYAWGCPVCTDMLSGNVIKADTHTVKCHAHKWAVVEMDRIMYDNPHILHRDAAALAVEMINNKIGQDVLTKLRIARPAYKTRKKE